MKRKRIFTLMVVTLVIFANMMSVHAMDTTDITEDSSTSNILPEPSNQIESPPSVLENEIQNEQISDSASSIPVSDIDIADVQSPMTVGTSQIISATVLPLDATDSTISFLSLTPEIATVNAIGRVKALNTGVAKIEVSAGTVSYIVEIHIESEKIEIPVQIIAIDVDYEETMIVGTTQMLSPSILPVNATAEYIFSTDNSVVARVNAFGKVEAVSPGKATITVSAADIKKDIVIYVKSEPEAEEIDLGDVQEEMTIGTMQVLNVSIYPADITNYTIQYDSSNLRILEVNFFGRINAVGIGMARITVRVGSISKSVTITVKDKIVPTDIDFDTDIKSINVGDSKMLSATVLPTNSVDQTVTYSTSDSSVLTVNEIGRIRGVSLGTATVTLKAGDISKSISIQVVAKNVVTSIEVNDFNDNMKVDETQSLTPSLYPSDAEDQKIKYTSSNPSVATVSEGGVVTAVGKGHATITLSAGTAIKNLDLTVYVATEQIQISDNYLIMQPFDSYKVYVSVKPVDADQNIQFRSTNENVAKITSDGIITAIGIGRASIILSNEDSMKSITVIVNDGTDTGQVDNENKNDAEMYESGFSEIISSLILEAENGKNISVDGKQYSYVTTDVLRTLYQTKKGLDIRYENYSVHIDGALIKNAKNSFSTLLLLVETDQGISFTVNDKQNLPGSLTLELFELEPEYKFLYLFNDATQKYERLNTLNGNMMTINVAGEYLLTAEKLSTFYPSFPIILLLISTLLIAVVVYIFAKRKYWFW